MYKEMQEKVRKIFDRDDENKNGVLERSEFCQVFKELIKSLAEGQSDEEIQKIVEEGIEKFDLNCNGKIEIEEFDQLMLFLINEKGLSLDDI